MSAQHVTEDPPARSADGATATFRNVLQPTLLEPSPRCGHCREQEDPSKLRESLRPGTYVCTDPADCKRIYDTRLYALLKDTSLGAIFKPSRGAR
jgi:hypothetical protein